MMDENATMIKTVPLTVASWDSHNKRSEEEKARGAAAIKAALDSLRKTAPELMKK